MRHLPGLVAAGLLAASTPALGAQIAGRVEIVDRGNVKRKAIRDAVVFVEAGDRITRGGVQPCHASKLPIGYMPIAW